jgi:hypothetical protein
VSVVWLVVITKEIWHRRTTSWGFIVGGGRVDEEPRPEVLVGGKGWATGEEGATSKRETSQPTDKG